MSKKTKTYPGIVIEMGKMIRSGNVISHEPTEQNKLGQSGLHTVADDILDIVLNSESEREAFKKIHSYFIDGEVEI